MLLTDWHVGSLKEAQRKKTDLFVGSFKFYKTLNPFCAGRRKTQNYVMPEFRHEEHLVAMQFGLM